MGFTRPWGRRALALVVTPVLASAAIVLPAAEAASADPANPTPVSSTALPTAQVNGVVWTQVVSNGIDYVGGAFTESQPAGAADGVSVTARSNLLAYDVSTGIAVPGFNPVTNAQVRGIAASPDGSRIYIVGDFTTVNGVARNHLAAIDATTGQTLSDFSPSLNARGGAVTVRGSIVYVGGAFTSAAGATRPRAAAFSTSGQLLAWSPQVADREVRALSVSPSGNKVLLGGSFTAVNGSSSPGRGLAATDSASGAPLPWSTGQLIQDGGVNSAIYSLVTRGDVVYASGYVFGDLSAGNFEGTVAMNWGDGSVKWIEDCHGDTYSTVPFNDAVYTASHAHDCTNIGGFGQTDPETYHRALAFSQAATHSLLHNTASPDHYQDYGGQPAPTLLGWSPSMTPGTYTGTEQAAWSVAAGGRYVVYGGEFTAVNGARQTGLVRFLGQPEAPDPSAPQVTTTPTPTPTSTASPTPIPSVSATPTPAPGTTASSKPAAPRSVSAVALGRTQLAIKWSVPSHGGKIARYTIILKKSGKTVHTTHLPGTKLRAVVAHLRRSTAYDLSVTATNASGTSPASHALRVKTKKSGATVSPTRTPSRSSISKASARGNHVLRVTWRGSKATGATPVSSYQIRVYRGSNLVKAVTVKGSARAVLVKGLKAATAYQVSVRAANFAGWGIASSRLEVRTRR